MMCFLHFQLECFHICMTLVKYRRVCLHSENHTTKVIRFQSSHNSGAQVGGYRVIEFWWESLGTCAECLETISEYNVNVDIREITCGCLVVNGIRPGSCPLGIIFCCTNMLVLILQPWNLGSARVDENLHKYLGPLCKCFDLTF